MDGGNEEQRHQRLYNDLRKKLLDLSRRNPMLNYKHRAGSRRQLRIVHNNLESIFAELTTNQKELPFAALPEPDDIPEDELTQAFKSALGHAKSTDIDYLTRLAALDSVARQDEASLTQLERWLRDRVREQLELPARPTRQEFNLIEHARKKGIEPTYDLSPTPPSDARIVRRLQSMYFADELDSRLARILADARLSEQETGLSTLFLAFGFLRWYESNVSDVANFAPLLLLPVQISKRLQGRRAVYSVRAASETPEINLSLREHLLRNSPDVSRRLPDFDDEADSVETYFAKVRSAIDGLGRWRIERNLTLGHFAFGRLAMYEDLSPENWAEPPVNHPLLESLLNGSETDSAASGLLFAPEYDLDNEEIEDVAPILINDADASQHSAIVDVMKGKNLVIEGPPGTGKSQTITNVIANALYAGKTILFLADKLAALEVVKDRLDASGLGDFCLELHSDKAHPKPIIESLKQRHDLGQYIGAEANWREDLQRLRSARGRVRDYLSALHERDENEGRSPFDLMWSAIAARRELSKEFDAARRIDLEKVFSKGWGEIDRCKDQLKLYAEAVEQYSERHGSFANSAWSKSGLILLSDDDPDIVADDIRDAHRCAEAYEVTLAECSTKTGVECPRSLSGIKSWIESVSRLPKIAEDYFLPSLGQFQSNEVVLASRLANERLELLSQPSLVLPSEDVKAIGQVAKQASEAGLAGLSPAEIVTSFSRMQRDQKSLIESLGVLTRLVGAFRRASPSVTDAREIAGIARFAKKVPSALDAYLWFDRANAEAALSEGVSRLLKLFEKDKALKAKFGLTTKTKWPPLADLRVVADVCGATGLQRIGNNLSGKSRRAARILKEVAATALADLSATDAKEAVLLVEELQAFATDSQLAAAANSAWSGLSTPLRELVGVLQERRRFDLEVGQLSDFVRTVHRALFSTNRKVIEAIRQYAPWGEQLVALLQQWPESLDNVPLSEVSERISARVEIFAILAAEIERLGLAELSASFAQIQTEIDRRLKIGTIEDRVASNPVFGAVGEPMLRTSNGCRALQISAEIIDAIDMASPASTIRSRLFCSGAANFRRSLDSATSSISLAIENYQRALARLSKSASLRMVGDEPSAVANQLSPLVADISSLREWIDVARRRTQLDSDGIDVLVTAFETAGLSHKRLPETFGALAFYYRAVRARQRRDVLRRMTSLDLQNERARFVAADEGMKRRQREAVRMRLLRATIPLGSAVGPRRDWTDLQCLRNEFTKQARHLPIRRLLSRSGKAVQTMKPCFMMSPLSLAKFLPAGILKFDLLVIDEASQMKPEDALGGLLRVGKTVVVGDPHQLPPTDFFSRVTPVDEGGSDDEEVDDISAESILDWSLKTFDAPRRLKWHYRSRCESLIAFSNREFYSSKPGSHGDLVTFPNARPESFSIDHVRVDGNYKASRNPAEVSRVVEAAIDFMIQHADMPEEDIPTLGIVAINIEQRDAIREEFNRSGRDEAIERYLSVCNKGTSKRGPEPFFIKNLENVQGDERDFIMISLTYGREAGQERVAQRFGPISRGQGHRRLNVLFTRARQRIILFSSFGSEDVLVSPTTSRGVRVLRDYLRYVESRRLEVGVQTGRDFDSDFERDVRSRLESRDFIVDPQVGVAGYRIDLGVRHPNQPTVYLAGIECDGAAFHSSKSSRDRDRLRESVLRGKGWSILRVWSTDWFANADLQTDRLVAELKKLAERPLVSQAHWTIVERSAKEDGRVTQGLDGSSRMLVEDVGLPSPPPVEGNCDLATTDLRTQLRALRDNEISQEFPGADPERSILRDIMIEKIVEARLDEPADFTRKIPLWLRERTDQRQLKFLERICSIVELS